MKVLTKNSPEFYTPTEAGKLLGISRIAVHKRIKAKTLLAKRYGKILLIPADALVPSRGKTLTPKAESQIQSAVKKVVREYGETLRMLEHA